MEPPRIFLTQTPGAITHYLQEWREGDETALARLTEALYQELRRLASATIQRQQSAQTIQPTELLHEFYVGLRGAARIDAESRAQFFGIAASTMRNILVDHARKRKAARRGGGVRVTLSDYAASDGALDVLEVHEALEHFARRYPRHAKVVELRFFGGLGAEETVLALANDGYECSLRTVERDWRFAKAWLQHALRVG